MITDHIDLSTNDLSQLFERDPLSLSDDDVATIVSYYRQERKNFLIEETRAKTTQTRIKTSAIKKPKDKELVQLNFEDLFPS